MLRRSKLNRIDPVKRASDRTLTPQDLQRAKQRAKEELKSRVQRQKEQEQRLKHKKLVEEKRQIILDKMDKLDKRTCCVTTFSAKQLKEYAHWFLTTYNLPFDLIIYSEDALDLSKYNKVFKYEYIYDDKEFNDFQKNATITQKQYNNIPRTSCTDRCPSYCLKHVNKHNINHICMTEACNKPRISHSGFCVEHYGGISKVVQMTKKFSFKVFALHNAYKKYHDTYDYMFWLDTDIKFHTYRNQLHFILLNNIFNITKQNMMLGYLKRWNTFLEAGIMLFNIKNTSPLTERYLKDMCDLYLTGKIYHIPQTHDAYVWDYMRHIYEEKYDAVNIDFTKNICEKNKYFGNCDVISVSYFSLYLSHYKGPRKHFMEETTSNAKYKAIDAGLWEGSTTLWGKESTKTFINSKNNNNTI